MADVRSGSTADARPSEPAWEIARLFPDQGHWSEEEYLDLKTNHLVEFSDGVIEVLPMPTMAHQMIVWFLHSSLAAFVMPRGLGLALFAPLRVRLWPGKIREPDVVFMRAEHAGRMVNEAWEGADLVMEVVSEDGRERDLEIKRDEYARAGIPEYWVVDPKEGRIVVLRLDGDRYAEHGTFERGQRASSHLLPGFEVDVAAALTGRP